MFYYGANATSAVNLPLTSMTSNTVLDSSPFLAPSSGTSLRLTPNASFGLPSLPPGLGPLQWIPALYNCSTQVQYVLQPGRNGSCAVRLPARVNRTVKCLECGITLNSAHQAQQHYSGKSHLRRVQRLEQQKQLACTAEVQSEDVDRPTSTSTASPLSSTSCSPFVQENDSPNADTSRKRSLSSVSEDELPKKSHRSDVMETDQNDVIVTGVDDVTNSESAPIRPSSENNSDVEASAAAAAAASAAGSTDNTVDDVSPVSGDNLTYSSGDRSSNSGSINNAATSEVTQTSATLSNCMNRTFSADPLCTAPSSSSFSSVVSFVPSSHCHQALLKSNLPRNSTPSMFPAVRQPCSLPNSASKSVAPRINDFVTRSMIPSFHLTGRHLAVRKTGSTASALNCYYVCPAQNPSNCNSRLTDIAMLSRIPANYLPVSQLSLSGTNAMQFAPTDDVTCSDVRANGRAPVVPAGTWTRGLNEPVLGQSLSLRSVIGMSVTNFAPQNHATYIRDVTMAQNPLSCNDFVRFAAETNKSLDSQSPACMQSKDSDWPASNQSEATHASQLTESLKSLDPVSKAVYENFCGKLTAPKSRNNRRRNHNFTRR